MHVSNLPSNLKRLITDSVPDAESTAFLCQPYSLGDAVLDLSLISGLRRRRPGIKIVFITSEYIGRVRWLLGPTVDRWIFLPHAELYELCSYAVKDFQPAGPGILNSMSPLDYAGPKSQKSLVKSAITELGEFPFKKIILGIGLDTKPNFPFDLTEALYKDAERIDSRPSVYINPRAQSTFPLPKVVVEQICYFLDYIGFKVYLDSHQDEYNLPDSVVQFSCTLQEAVQRAYLSDIVLTYRSGLTDLLATLVNHLVVLYPCRSYTKGHFDYRSYNTVILGLRQQEESIYDFWGADFPITPDFVQVHVAGRLGFLKDWIKHNRG